MANILAVLVAFFVFLLMFLVKVPIKKITYRIAVGREKDDPERQYALYRHMNVVLVILTVVLAVLAYYIICIL